MMIKTYRRRPVETQAVQWTGDNTSEIMGFMRGKDYSCNKSYGLIIYTLEGNMHASLGDFIIKGIQGEFHPCKPDIFALTYEEQD